MTVFDDPSIHAIKATFPTASKAELDKWRSILELARLPSCIDKVLWASDDPIRLVGTLTDGRVFLLCASEQYVYGTVCRGLDTSIRHTLDDLSERFTSDMLSDDALMKKVKESMC